MDHFMSEGGEHFFLWPVPEVGRVQGDLIGECAVSTTKSITAKIPVALLASLQRDKAIRKRTIEQGAIQSLVCLLQRIVSLTRRLEGLNVCIGHGRSPLCSARLRFTLECASQQSWDVHRSSHQTPSGVIAKMDKADSAFPRAFLAL
jgi:hypothetical protein